MIIGAAVYGSEIQDGKTFVWLLMVDSDKPPQIPEAKMLNQSAEAVRIKIGLTQDKRVMMNIPISGSIHNVSIEKE